MAMQIMENARRRAMNRLPQPAQAQAANADPGTMRDPRRPDVGFTDPPVPNPTPYPPSTPDFPSPRGPLHIPGQRPGNDGINPAGFNGNRMDEGVIQSYLQRWSRMPGVDPSVGNDPGYWSRRIKETGGLGADNEAYWQDMAMNNWHRPPHGQASAGGASPISMILQMLASRMGSSPQMPGLSGMAGPTMPTAQTPAVDINAIVNQALRGY